MTAVLAVVGPTASGKTALALELAERLNSEIISADSMQLFRGMEIGTGAPTAAERARVPHHLVGFMEPGAHYSAGQFQIDARAIVHSLNARGVPAVVVGGSGLYVSALIDGLFEGPSRDLAVRARLESEAESIGAQPLYARLQELDPDYAALIHPQDLIRIVRGLEVFELSGKPLSAHHQEQQAAAAPLEAVKVALAWHPRKLLYDRINARVDDMIARGWLDEVRALLDAGYSDYLHQRRALGYRELTLYLEGACDLDTALAAIKQNTRRYAKRQLTWFRADSRIHWLPDPHTRSTASLAGQLHGIRRRSTSLRRCVFPSSI